jgi:hypothetical protein
VVRELEGQCGCQTLPSCEGHWFLGLDAGY